MAMIKTCISTRTKICTFRYVQAEKILVQFSVAD